MGRLGYVQWEWIAITISLFLFLPACGGNKPPGASPFPAKITLNPSISASLQVGGTLVFTASAQNASNTNINTTFTYSLAPTSPSGILDISPAGFACAGSWNAPYYNVCTPAGVGVVQVIAAALGSTSPPTTIFVHPPIDSVQISVVPPVNSPPPACPTQTALPAACNIPFNTGNCTTQHNAQGVPYLSCSCLSQNQQETLQATAYSHGVDVTALAGPFTWSQANLNVVKITPIVSSSSNVITNQATAESSTPGATQVVASVSGISSQPYIAETCPVQCITLEVSQNGSQNPGQTSFLTNKSTSENILATAVDVQGCMVPKPPLTWTSSSPAALSSGGTTGCAAGTTCAVSTTQAGAAAITASCTPPTCNVGFPLNAPNLQPLYLPQPVYPVTAISGLVIGAADSTSVLASSQDCYSSSLCPVALYDISTSKNLASGPSSMPNPPNSLMFDPAGDKAYAGSQYGAMLVSISNLGSSSTNPFSLLPAAGTTLGVVTGKVLAVSPNGNIAVFSDTVSTPNQVYVVNASTASSASSTRLNINSAITAAFSPDNSKAFILGDGGNTLYVYSALQALQTYPLTAPAGTIAFSSTGAFAFITGGNTGSNLTIRNTCDNSPTSLSITGLPSTPTFLKMVPAGNVSMGSTIIPTLQQDGVALDFFFGIDNSGIDIIATATTTPVNPQPSTLCPQQQIALPTYVQNGSINTFNPVYINLQKGTFHPISLFISPDATKVYIVTSDLGVLIYSFSTQSVSAIPLLNNAAPVAADITADGTLIYVAGTDGMLHQVSTVLGADQTPPVFFSELPNSTNNFCYMNYACTLNLVAVRP